MPRETMYEGNIGVLSVSTIIKHHSVLTKRKREKGTFLTYRNIQRKYVSPPGMENTKSSGFEERDRGPSGHTAAGRWASVLVFGVLRLPSHAPPTAIVRKTRAAGDICRGDEGGEMNWRKCLREGKTSRRRGGESKPEKL